MQTNLPPAPRTTRTRIALLFWVALTMALLILAMGAPAWASSGPSDWQQGTVPLPPPDPGGGGSGGGSGNGDDDGNDSPAATATPAGQPTVAPTVAITSATAMTMGVPANEKGIVVAPRLNMRSGAGVSFPVVGRVVQSQTVTIQFRNAAGDWWYTCCTSGTTTSGWVSALFVRPTSFDAADASSVLPVAGNAPVVQAPAAPVSTPVAVAPSGGLSGTVSVARLNLRDEPSTKGAILGKMLQGQVVRVNARNEDATWWYICCLAGDSLVDTSGWVSADFIAPNFARANAATLLPVFEPVSVVLPTPTPRAGTVPAVTAATAATTTLQLDIVQQPEFAVPGALLTLQYTITNTGDAPATVVELRNELTPTLTLVGGAASKGGLLRQSKTPEGRTVVVVSWPMLESGAVATATVALSVAPSVAVGDVIDNIAAVSATNAEAQTGGVRIGMPPASLPDFQ